MCHSSVRVIELNNPELEAKAKDWEMRTGRPFQELVEDAIAGYLDEQCEVCKTLDNRYDDILSGKVKLIPGDEIEAYFKSKAAATPSRD